MDKITLYDTTAQDALDVGTLNEPTEGCGGRENSDAWPGEDEEEKKRRVRQTIYQQQHNPVIQETIRATAAPGARTAVAPKPNRPRLLYRSREAMAAIGCGHSKFYDLINSGVLDARRFGARTYITAESLEAFVASLPRAITPTLAKAAHDRWSGHHKPQPKPQKDRPGATE
jgi:hypothetical protein